jgi:hypothetical protein
MGSLFAAFVCLVVYAHLPFKALEILNSSEASEEIKQAARKQFKRVSLKAISILPLDLVSPIVVPFILLFTKWEAEELPFLDSIWGNDVSINGDRRFHGGLVPLDKNSQEAIDACYWAPGHHPRSFYARWVWLGLRNRASKLSLNLGKDIDLTQETIYLFSSNQHRDGDMVRKIDNELTWLIRVSKEKGTNAPIVSIFAYSPWALNKHRRIYFGHKIPPTIPEWNGRALLATVGWSLR